MLKLRQLRSGSLVSVSLALALLGTSGCQTATQQLQERMTMSPKSDVFFASFEDVEEAMKHSMAQYPPRIDNMEAGIFETDFIRGPARFRPPHMLDEALPPSLRYRIIIRLVRGRKDGRQGIKVQVQRVNEIVKDFFSESQPVPSDGFEEEAILYRIGRELEIKRAIRRLTEKENERKRQRRR